MAKKALVTYLHKVIDKFEQDGKPFNLVMLLPVESLVNKKINVIFSATWMDNMESHDAIGVLFDAIIAQMGPIQPPEFAQIARVTPIRSTDPIVTEITDDYEIKKGSVRLPNCYINGNLIEGAVILQSINPMPDVKSVPSLQPEAGHTSASIDL